MGSVSTATRSGRDSEHTFQVQNCLEIALKSVWDWRKWGYELTERWVILKDTSGGKIRIYWTQWIWSKRVRVCNLWLSCWVSLTFPKVHGLEHVSLGDAILLGGIEELGDLLHLLEGHGWALDLLHRFLPSEQAVDQFTQNLGRVTHGPGEGIEGGTWGGNGGQMSSQIAELTHPSFSQAWNPILPDSGLPTPEPHWREIHSTRICSRSGSYLLSILSWTCRLMP